MVGISSSTLIGVLFAGLSYILLTGATHFHVNRGCIYINGINTCAPHSQNIPSGSCNVEARLDTSNHCFKTFRWPANYGDVYYGADNCLYDSKGQNIDGQCCT